MAAIELIVAAVALIGRIVAAPILQLMWSPVAILA
jgi:hypothetical protein